MMPPYNPNSTKPNTEIKRKSRAKQKEKRTEQLAQKRAKGRECVAKWRAKQQAEAARENLTNREVLAPISETSRSLQAPQRPHQRTSTTTASNIMFSSIFSAKKKTPPRRPSSQPRRSSLPSASATLPSTPRNPGIINGGMMTPQLANIIAMDQVNDETLALHQSLVKKRREERKTNEEVNEAYKKKELEMFQKSIENSWADRNKRTEVEQQTRKEEDAELLLLVSAKKRNMSTAKKSLDPLVTHERSAAASEIGRTVLRFEADNPPPTVGAAPPSLQELAPVATGGGVPLVPAAAPWQSNPSAAMAFAPWQHNHSPLFIGGLDQATIEAAYFAEFGNNGSNNKEEYCNKEVGVDEGDAEESSQEESSQEDQEDEEDDGFGSDDSSDSALLGLPPAASKRTSSPLAPKPKATVRAAAPKPKATAPRAQKRKAMAPVQATSVAGPPQKKKTKRELRIEAMAKAKVLMAQDKEQVENNKARQRAAVVPAMPRTEVWEEDALKGMKNAELRIILKGMSVPTKEKWTKAYLTKLILAEQCLE